MTDPERRWEAPHTMVRFWWTLDEAMTRIAPKNDAVIGAILGVLTQGQQENVLRALGWTERKLDVPPKVEKPDA